MTREKANSKSPRLPWHFLTDPLGILPVEREIPQDARGHNYPKKWWKHDSISIFRRAPLKHKPRRNRLRAQFLPAELNPYVSLLPRLKVLLHVIGFPTHCSESRSNDFCPDTIQFKISQDRLYCFNSGVLARIWIDGFPFPLVHLKQLGPRI